MELFITCIRNWLSENPCWHDTPITLTICPYYISIESKYLNKNIQCSDSADGPKNTLDAFRYIHRSGVLSGYSNVSVSFSTDCAKLMIFDDMIYSYTKIKLLRDYWDNLETIIVPYDYIDYSPYLHFNLTFNGKRTTIELTRVHYRDMGRVVVKQSSDLLNALMEF